MTATTDAILDRAPDRARRERETRERGGRGRGRRRPASPRVLAALAACAVLLPSASRAGEPDIWIAEQIELKLFSKTKGIAPVRAPSIDLPAVTFAFDSATLTDAARRQLDELGRVLSKPAASGRRFVVGGHTDAVGGSLYNAGLSRRRADAVVRYLVSAWGVSGASLTPVGYGESRPLPGLGPDDPAQRRAEIVNAGAADRR